mgnify:FL=1
MSTTTKFKGDIQFNNGEKDVLLSEFPTIDEVNDALGELRKYNDVTYKIKNEVKYTNNVEFIGLPFTNSVKFETIPDNFHVKFYRCKLNTEDEKDIMFDISIDSLSNLNFEELTDKLIFK